MEHYTDPTGIWLKIAQKATGTQSISYAEALEGALCYGWIDGQKVAFDEHYWLQKFTPRRPKSVWSWINREKANALLEAGRMQPSGLRQVELARADGRGDAAYAGQSGATVPDDLQEALDNNPLARLFSHLKQRESLCHHLQSPDCEKSRDAGGQNTEVCGNAGSRYSCTGEIL